MAKDTPSLWPREHGAYVQLALALLCGAALGRSWRGAAQAVLTAGLFLASEPVLVLMGRRGRQAATDKVRAGLRLLLIGSVTLLAALFAWGGAPAPALLSLFPAAALGGVLFLLFLARLERTAGGELVAAWAFAACAGCVAALGGAGGPRARALTFFLAGLFSLGTALVHCHLIALKRGGSWLPRAIAFALGVALTAWAWVLARHGARAWTGPAVYLPMTLAALSVWLAPPEPRRLKALGWLAATGALAGGALAVFRLF